MGNFCIIVISTCHEAELLFQFALSLCLLFGIQQNTKLLRFTCHYCVGFIHGLGNRSHGIVKHCRGYFCFVVVEIGGFLSVGVLRLCIT